MVRRVVVFLMLAAIPAFADTKPAPPKGIAGVWLGTLKAGALEIRIAFTVTSKPDGSLAATMDSPDQEVKDIPVESVTFADDTLTLKMPKLQASFSGKLQAEGDTLKGTFEQGAKFPIDLKRVDKVSSGNRPQMPKKPYPYVEETVAFDSRAKGVKLAGTFTKPKGDGKFATAILITGSGPQDRDESLLGHKPFLVLADHLTRNGIAVLRFDDRGVGKSTGNFAAATTKDFAEDVAGAVAYLKTRTDVGKIGLIGHSEGGLIAPMVAAESADVAFIVLLAGPGLPGDEILFAQGQLIVKAMGGDAKALARQKEVQLKLIAVAKEGGDEEKLKAAMAEITKTLSPAEQKAAKDAGGGAQAEQLASPWYRFFLNFDPRPTLQKVKCPVLAINGEKDLQVPPKEDLAEIEKALKAGGNKDVTVKEMPGLNHLFQTSKTGLPSEYGKIEETFAPAALEVISTWILKRK